MNQLFALLDSREMLAAYNRIRHELSLDSDLLQSVSVAAKACGKEFVLPSLVSPGDIESGHQMAANMLTRYSRLLDYQELFFLTLEELLSRLKTRGLDPLCERLLELATLSFRDEFKVRLTESAEWQTFWRLSPVANSLTSDYQISISVFSRSSGDIVPWDVFQYVRSGILLYRQGAFATSLALLAIAVEATLRDVLSSRGYGFVPRASREAEYAATEAEVMAHDSSYLITFRKPMPRAPSELPASSGGRLPAEVTLRRKKPRGESRYDITLTCPVFLVDHLAPDTVVREAMNKSIGSLGEALEIARHREGVLHPTDLPTDVDPILKQLRNNLVHFSRDSLSVELRPNPKSSDPVQFTLRDFLNANDKIFDLVTIIPDFVSRQYLRLLQNGSGPEGTMANPS